MNSAGVAYSRFNRAEQKRWAEIGIALSSVVREPLLLLGFDLKVREANQSFYRHFRLKPAETEGCLIFELSHGHWNIPALRKLLLQIASRTSAYDDLELEHEFAGIGRRNLLVNFRRIDESDLLLLAFEDFTERKRVQGALRDSENRWRLAVESAALGTWDWDMVADRLTWSDRAKEICRLSRDTDISFDLFVHTVHEEDRARVEKALERALDLTSGGRYRVDYRLRRQASEREIWVDVSGQVFFDPFGHPIRFIGTVTDITARTRANDERIRLTEELSRSNQSLQEFAHAVSHDLKEPLRMISSYLRILKKEHGGVLTESAREYIDYASNGAERLKALVDGVLKLSKLGREQRGFQTVDCNRIVGQVIRDLDLSIRESQARISVDPLPEVYGDPVLLSELFQNMISNALKYRDVREPEVHISGQQSSDEFLFRIRDNGIGFDMKFRDQVFGLFRRLHSNGHYEGTGIGLATCKKIVELHAGHIWVESTPGQGSIFYFTLPAGRSRGG